MASSGTSSPISRQDARDLLHKLITESTKVQLVLSSTWGTSAVIAGRLAAFREGKLCVRDGDEQRSPLVMFDFANAASFTYGDNRAFSGETVAGGPFLSSALTLVFPDGLTLTLFEIA